MTPSQEQMLEGLLAERRQTEAALRESEEKYRSIVDATSEGVWTVDGEFYTTFVNQQMARMLGYTAEEMQGLSILEFLFPEDRSLMEARFGQRCQGQPGQYDFRYRRKDGTALWVFSTTTPRYDAEGCFVGAIGMFADITERKRIEEALRHSEELYRTLAETVPDIIFTNDSEGRCDYCSPRWYAYTGLTEAETQGWGWIAAIHPEDTTRTQRWWADVVQKGKAHDIEYRVRARNGSYRWFLGRVQPVRDANGRILRWVGCCTDIDAQKQREETQRFLAELGDRLRAYETPEEVLKEIVQAVVERLAVSRCSYSVIDQENDRFTTLETYARDSPDIRGTYTLSVFGAAMLEDLRRGKTVIIQDASTDPRMSPYFEASYRPMNTCATVIVPLHQEGRWKASLSVSAADRPRAWTPEEIALLEQVAERTGLAVENMRLEAAHQRTEVEVRRLNADLEQRISEFEALNVRLQRAMGETHHRIKNNLQVIMALLNMETMQHEAAVPTENIRQISHHVQALSVLHDLLTQQAKSDALVESLSAKTAIERILALIQKIADGRTLRYHVEDTQVPVGQSTALALLVNELISNAIKHGRGDVELDFRVAAGKGRLEVTDEGPGFPDGFDPQVSAHTGLELIESLASWDLKGSIHYTNRAGGGACIVVEFPLVEGREV